MGNQCAMQLNCCIGFLSKFVETLLRKWFYFKGVKTLLQISVQKQSQLITSLFMRCLLSYADSWLCLKLIMYMMISHISSQTRVTNSAQLGGRRKLSNNFSTNWSQLMQIGCYEQPGKCLVTSITTSNTFCGQLQSNFLLNQFKHCHVLISIICQLNV